MMTITTKCKNCNESYVTTMSSQTSPITNTICPHCKELNSPNKNKKNVTNVTVNKTSEAVEKKPIEEVNLERVEKIIEVPTPKFEKESKTVSIDIEIKDDLENLKNDILEVDKKETKENTNKENANKETRKRK